MRPHFPGWLIPIALSLCFPSLAEGADSDSRTDRTRVAAISLIWDEGHRTLDATLTALDEAGRLGADLACLPEECVEQPTEPIPGPTSLAIAEKAAKYRMYVVGNLREQDEGKAYVTSLLCDRQGKIVGNSRRSSRSGPISKVVRCSAASRLQSATTGW